MLKQAAHQTNMYAGDGTTTSTLMARYILEEGLKYIQNNVSPIEIKRGLDKGKAEMLDFLKEIAIPCDTPEHYYHIAMVSSNYDQILSNIISEAVHEVGAFGAIEIEPGYGPISELRLI